MASVCLYFTAHQPYRLKKYAGSDIDVLHAYTDEQASMEAINRHADESYLPANTILLEQLRVQEGKFCISYAVSGTLLEQLEAWRPDVIVSLRKLVDTGRVEILGETYYHSLSSLHSRNEFRRQVEKHSRLVSRLFGLRPAVFRNTELIHNNSLAEMIGRMGFRGILCEGTERMLKGRSPNRVYALPGGQGPGLLLRNARLSDDIAFRFDNTGWNEHPLTAEKFAEWLHQHPPGAKVINLMVDIETFGIHKKRETGIFEFLTALPEAVIANEHFSFSLPSSVLARDTGQDVYDVPSTISWEDRANASCVWSENMMQNNTLKKIYSLEKLLAAADDEMLACWGRLQSAEHFYYMSDESCKKTAYRQHNPFLTPHDAFQNYTNIVADLEISLIREKIRGMKTHSTSVPVTGNFY